MTGNTETSLSERMGLSEQEIDRRLHMFDFTASTRADLASFAAPLEAGLQDIVDDFYTLQLSNTEIAAIIGAPDTLARLRNVMLTYITTLFSGNFDESYIDGRLRIGKIHKQLSVTPRLYMSGISNLQTVLDRHIEAASENGVDGEAIKNALHKALLFDTQLVFDAYIDGYQQEMEQARAEVHRYASSLELRVETLTRQLHEQSIRDSLTGLYNRRTFHRTLEHELNVAQRFELPLCLVYFDLNRFKAVNDTYGHEAGDTVLRQVGESLLSVTRSVDIGCRYGGDEFCIIMPRCEIDNAVAPLQRLIERFESLCQHDVTFSVGVVQSGPTDFENAQALINQADTRMYKAKAKAHEAPGHHMRTAT